MCLLSQDYPANKQQNHEIPGRDLVGFSLRGLDSYSSAFWISFSIYKHNATEAASINNTLNLYIQPI